MRILLVEDNERVVDVVERALKARGHTSITARGVGEASRALGSQQFDVVVVDIGLPDGSGLDLCRAERKRGLDVPMLLLTARVDVRSRVEGLDSGADDYLGKPFAVDELVARVHALARRGPRWQESVRSFGNVVIDRDRRVITCSGARVPLTPRELDIVAFLAWRDGRVASREEILEAVWGDVSARASSSFEVLLARIRRKLEERGIVESIRNIRQVGYAWALDRSKPA